MTAVALLFPNQLYKDHPALEESVDQVLLVEDSLFFGDGQYPIQFHKQKLAYHRATMAHYAEHLALHGYSVEIIRYKTENVLEPLCHRLKSEGAVKLFVVAITDFLLARRLRRAADSAGLEISELPDPGFVNSPAENKDWRAGQKRWFMADFYRWQRQRLAILTVNDKPKGGKWSFDEDNRKKLPRKEIPLLPGVPSIARDSLIDAAIASIEAEFPDNPGSLDRWHYPVTHRQAEQWLQNFLEHRFQKFGHYEDAIVAGQSWLHHSVLSPMLNTGLLTPSQVVDQALTFAENHDTPLNSVEGFIRQIIGWREFMRATYHDLSVPMRTSNYWNHHRALPSGFYDGTTGIDPIDDIIIRILDTGYCHHIERLMALGGFMFLCETDPDEIYQWFMSMFIDSYDWVMVPNVYAMSQHADGGLITTKPYFSGSNYVLKMSNYKKGDWSVIWDGLFWRWIHTHQETLADNPRWAMMVKNVNRMDSPKLQAHLAAAEGFLSSD